MPALQSDPCAHSGPAADGLYTSANGYDFGDPANQEMPQIAEFFDVMEARGESELAISAAAGWWAGEITVAIIKQAMNSPEGLTRASIINAARNFEYVSNYALPGVVFRMKLSTSKNRAESAPKSRHSPTSASNAPRRSPKKRLTIERPVESDTDGPPGRGET